MIVAVACDRDLTSGIQDIYPLPVYGILNKRQNGPCYDTDVDLEKVEEGVINFLEYQGTGTKESVSEDAQQAR